MSRDDDGSSGGLGDAPLGVSGLIIAGGRSRRMGRDKALLEIDGTTLLARTVDVLGELTDEIFVVGRTVLPAAVRDAYAVPDDIPDAGPLGGLMTGLRLTTRQRVVAVSCDLPFLRVEVMRYLLGLAEGYEAIIPRLGGQPQPLAAVYDRSVGVRARESVARGEFRVLDLLASLRVRWVDDSELQTLDPTLQSFTNVNTIEEWRAAGRLLKG